MSGETGAVPPHRPRGPGDAWVELPDGRRFWGRFGAAGLLVSAPDDAVLLQHRVAWSHFGGTWGLPGGARQPAESAREAAFREAFEETGIDTALLTPRSAVVLDLGEWTYTTVLSTAEARLPVAVSDAESTALQWTAAAEVAALPLHPGFADAWPTLRPLVSRRDVLVIDAANVVGSRPDGWWRDRRGAADALLRGLAALARDGIPVERTAVALPVVHRWPEIVAVLEGRARGGETPLGVTVVEAPGEGDATILDEARRRIGAGWAVTVVTADRALRADCESVGAEVTGPGRLLEEIDRTG